MRRQQQMRFDSSYAMKVWQYISKPFQITKVLELLYMLDWVWLALLSFLPQRFVAGTLFDALHTLLPIAAVRLLLTSIAAAHIFGLFANNLYVRKAVLLFNIGILLYITVYAFQVTARAAAGLGYYMILIGISIFAFWRMDDT